MKIFEKLNISKFSNYFIKITIIPIMCRNVKPFDQRVWSKVDSDFFIEAF